MTWFRDILYIPALIAISPLLIYRLVRTGKWRTDWPARLGRCRLDPHWQNDERPVLLIHAVSVGEVNAIRGLVDQLLQPNSDANSTQPDIRLAISTTTDTGFARATALFAGRAAVVRYPFDFTRSVGRFLDSIQPSVVALVELEVWPNFVQTCVRREIPIGIINGRLSARSFRGYRRIRALIAPTFRKLAFAAVQTEDYAQRFKAMGVQPDRVIVTDSMKWDNAHIESKDKLPGADRLAMELGIDRNRPLIVAGSTGPGEEQFLIDTCPAHAQLLIAPRKPERFEEVARLDARFIRRTDHPKGTTRAVDAATRLFLLDTIGELRTAYALADIAIVGRSFLGMHGSDPLDPISLGVPTLIGPHYGDFTDLVEALHAQTGLVITDQPGQHAARLLDDPQGGEAMAGRGRQVIQAKQGATTRHAALLLDRLHTRQSAITR